MCIGDWRLGRLITTRSINWNYGSSTNLIIPPNQQRVGISVGAFDAGVSGASSVVVGINGVTNFAFAGESPFHHFTVLEHGELPTLRWEIIAVAGANEGAWIEYFLPEYVLSAAIKQFESEYGKRF